AAGGVAGAVVSVVAGAGGFAVVAAGGGVFFAEGGAVVGLVCCEANEATLTLQTIHRRKQCDRRRGDFRTRATVRGMVGMATIHLRSIFGEDCYYTQTGSRRNNILR